MNERAEGMTENAAGEPSALGQPAAEMGSVSETPPGDITGNWDAAEKPPTQQPSTDGARENVGSAAARAAAAVPEPVKRAAVQGRQVLQQAARPLASSAARVPSSNVAPMLLSFVLGVLSVLAVQSVLRRRRRRPRSLRQGLVRRVEQVASEAQGAAGKLAPVARVRRRRSRRRFLVV